MPPMTDKDRLYRLFSAFIQRVNSDPALASRLASLNYRLGFHLDDLDADIVLDAHAVPLHARTGRPKTPPDLTIETTGDAMHAFWLGQLPLADLLARSRVTGDAAALTDHADDLASAFAVYADLARRRRMEAGLTASRAALSEGHVAPSDATIPTDETLSEVAAPPAAPAKPKGRSRRKPTAETSPPAEASAEPPAAIAAPVVEPSEAAPAKPKGRSRRKPATEAPPAGAERPRAPAEPAETTPVAAEPLAAETGAPVAAEVEALEQLAAPEPVAGMETTPVEAEPLAAETGAPVAAEVEALEQLAAPEPAAETTPPAAPEAAKPARSRRGRGGKQREAAASPPAVPPAPSAAAAEVVSPQPVAGPTVEAPPPTQPRRSDTPQTESGQRGRPQARDKRRDQRAVFPLPASPSTALITQPPPPGQAPSVGVPSRPAPTAASARLRAAIESLGRRLIPVVEGDAARRKVERLDQALPTDETALRLEMLRRMTLIRAVETRLTEEREAHRLPAAELAFSDGQEGLAVAACFTLRPNDMVVTTHRSIGPFLARGSDPAALVAEVYGRAAGLNGGKGGPQNLSDTRVGALATAIVGASPILATGFALAARLQKTDQVALCFLGDGASNQGMFHEALNFAAVRELPVVFVLINNGAADETPAEETSRVANLAQRAVAYGMGNATVDGADVWAVYRSIRAAVRVARGGGGPTLIEVKVAPLSELAEGQREGKDALVRLYKALVEARTLSPADARELAAAAQLQADRAVEWAQRASNPPAEALTTFVYSPEPVTLYRPTPVRVANRQLTMAAAVQEALAGALRADPSVYLIGVGIASGGRFRTVEGLLKRFGPERVIDAPISPNAIIGASVTAAASGLRPVIDIGFGDFLTLAADPIVNQAAKLRYMTSGQYRAPLVIRVASGPAQGWGSQLSQALEGWFAAVPGLLVAVPSGPYEAKGLLTAAIRSNNPVLIFEPKALYEARGPVPQDDYIVPLGVADVKRSGRHCTIVAVGAAVGEAMAAAETLASEGISAEVIDPRTLMPFDWATVLESAGRTGRLVIVEEAPITLGWGAEVAAQAAAYLFDLLHAPIVRIAAAPVPVPYSPALAREALVGADQVISAVRRLMRGG